MREDVLENSEGSTENKEAKNGTGNLFIFSFSSKINLKNKQFENVICYSITWYNI